MQLPKPILDEIRRYFDPHHPAWHLARVKEADLQTPAQRAAWKQARKMFLTLKFRGDPGAGDDFVRFHRDMMREYKWILAQHPGAGVHYDPWPAIPDDVRKVIESNFPNEVAQGTQGVDRLTTQGSRDQLGAFIEPDPQGVFTNGQGLHDLSHGAVAEIEQATVPQEFSMGSPSTAHRNLIFYRLHGWIDERYAEWQRAHGEQPDLTPLKPADMNGGDHHRFNLEAALDIFAASHIAKAADELVRFPVLRARP